MKKIRKLLCIMSVLALLSASLMGNIEYHAFNKDYYAYKYNQLNTAESLGMSEETLNEATFALLDYLREERDDILVKGKVFGLEREIYNERETLHMVDVLALYQNARTIIWGFTGIGILVLILMIIQYYRKKEERLEILQDFGFSFKQVTLGFIIVIAFLAGYALMDFNAFWTAFHLIFFDNDLWLLNPATSIMINMFPLEFFAGMVFRITSGFIVTYGACALICYFMIKNKLKAR